MEARAKAPAPSREKKVLPFRRPVTREEVPVQQPPASNALPVRDSGTRLGMQAVPPGPISMHQQPDSKALPIKDPRTRQVIEVTTVGIPRKAAHVLSPAAPAYHPLPAQGTANRIDTREPPKALDSSTMGVWPWGSGVYSADVQQPLYMPDTADALGHQGRFAGTNADTEEGEETSVEEEEEEEEEDEHEEEEGEEGEEGKEGAAEEAEAGDEEEEEDDDDNNNEEEEEDEDEEDDEEDEEEEDAEELQGQPNGATPPLLTLKDTWGMFVSLDVDHRQDDGQENGIARTALTPLPQPCAAPNVAQEKPVPLLALDTDHPEAQPEMAKRDPNQPSHEPEATSNGSVVAGAEDTNDTSTAARAGQGARAWGCSGRRTALQGSTGQGQLGWGGAATGLGMAGTGRAVA